MTPLRFVGQWRIPADPDRVFAALVDVESYPQWWPGVTSVQRRNATSGEIRLRSTPVDVVFTATQRVVDSGERVLVAAFDGDLEGTGRWDISAAADGCTARYDESFVVRAGLVSSLGPFARPLIRASHDHMMRRGESALIRRLRGAANGR
jgi:carbon monoxide dehydrogenase subunit G